MKTSGLSFYFILYLVAIITVFAITVERDRVLHERDQVIAHLISVYVKPLTLSAYVDTSRFFLEPNSTRTRDSIGMRIKIEGPIDRRDVDFKLLKAERMAPGGRREDMPLTGVVKNENGNGILFYPALEEGVYEFRVSGYKRRIITEGRSMSVVIGDTTYAVPYSETLEGVDRDTTVLIARVERTGVVPPQFTLNVQEAQENWVLGPPYRKKIFVGGVENIQRASFSVTAPGRIESVSGAGSYITFIWDRPELGKRTFTVSGDAQRGFGEKDRATITYSVEVVPATFVSTPLTKAFWGIPYAFDAQLVGLNPLDLTVETLHDGQSLGIKPAVPKLSITPEKTWNSLRFKVLYQGVVIKEHQVPVAAPPPPQIKWVQQNLDRARNVFVISVTASDPVGGGVRMSLQSEPPGISRLDKIQGTAFTVTVNLESKPSAVFIKLSATDQYGGQSISTKQFNIPQ